MNTFFFFKGRVALYAILKAMGIGPGDEVILPGFTCVVVPNAIVYLGATPVYADIDAATYNIDPVKIEKRVSPRTRCIIAQHTFGIPADMDMINKIAGKYDLYVIEDSCHALGTKYKGKEVGTFGDAAFFSSQWSKPLTTGLGGWAVINNGLLLPNMGKIHRACLSPSGRESLLLRLQYQVYSRAFKPSLFWFAQGAYRKLSHLGLTIGSSSNEELQCRMPDRYEKKMASWQTNLIKKKLADSDRAIHHRKWITSLYETFLKEAGIKTVKLPKTYEAVFLRYPVLVNNKKYVLKEAQKMKIELGDWFLSPIHPNLDGWEKAGYKRGICPIAEDVCEHIINLPTHHGIGIKEVRRIVQLLDQFDR